MFLLFNNFFPSSRICRWAICIGINQAFIYLTFKFDLIALPIGIVCACWLDKIWDCFSWWGFWLCC